MVYVRTCQTFITDFNRSIVFVFLFISFPEPLELSRVLTSPEVIQSYKELLRKAGGDNHKDRVGADRASNSHLPSHSDVHISCISQQRVQVKHVGQHLYMNGNRYIRGFPFIKILLKKWNCYKKYVSNIESNKLVTKLFSCRHKKYLLPIIIHQSIMSIFDECFVCVTCWFHVLFMSPVSSVFCDCYCTFQGLAYFLEDGRSAVSPNEALMWAKVNPFSPLATGLRINPFWWRTH